jgi:hypothetical protein
MKDFERPGDLDSAQSSLLSRSPLPRRKLGGGVVALLLFLRVYVLIAVPLIAYAFFKAL